MAIRRTCSHLILLLLLICCSVNALAESIKVAVASNFTRTISEIAQRFETESGHHVTLIFGSSGKHYAQIKNGAPYDVFLSADSLRPQLLETDGSAINGSRFTYAIGQIALWKPKATGSVLNSTVLSQQDFRFLAIANPRLAPYGKASQQILTTLHLWDKLSTKMVRGENINQTLQFVKSGNAELGFVAMSQLRQETQGAYWAVPQELYTPIEQQAVLLKEKVSARAFLKYLQSPAIINLIQQNGYSTNL